MTVFGGSQDYYTGNLEKRFNYFWGARPGVSNAWLEFVRLVDANPSTPAIREDFYSLYGMKRVMSRGAYYRWLRSLNHQRADSIT